MGAEVLALVIGYLLGSIPTAYIVTRIAIGRDMGATFGVLFVLMPLYRYWFGVLIFIATIGGAFLVTRNVGISMGTGLLFLPLIVWQMAGALMPVAIATGIVIGIKYLPTFRLGWERNRSVRDFVFDRWQRQRNEQRRRR